MCSYSSSWICSFRCMSWKFVCVICAVTARTGACSQDPCRSCVCLDPVCQTLFCSTFCALQCRPAVLFLAFVIDAAFALAIVGFLIMHCRMIARNMTTIEMYEKRRSATGPWQFDRGAKQNFLEVFGKRCRCCYVTLSHHALLLAHGSQSRVMPGAPLLGQWYVCLRCGP